MPIFPRKILPLAAMAVAAFVSPAAHSGNTSAHRLRAERSGRSIPRAKTATATVPHGEIRAMWIVRDSLTSPEKIHNAVALAKRYHFNTIFVQIRGRGDAFYNSRYEPRAEELAGQPTTFDPLATTIAEGHRQGLEVHAWMNTFFVWHKSRRPYSSSHIVNRHPEWLVQDRDGNTTMVEKHDIEGAFLDPAIPDVRDYTQKVFLDVVSHYAIDGIHFDYVRFPGSAYSFSRGDLAAFRTWLTPQLPLADAAYADDRATKNRLAWYYCFPEHWREWRRQIVTATVKSISDEAHRIRPGIIVSAAVFPIYRVASEDKGQAWHEWLQTGLLDAACPMTYGKTTEAVGAQIRDAVACSCGKPIVAGVGAWQVPAESAVAKGIVYRQLGASGVNFFSYDGMTRDGRTEAYLARVAHELFPDPAPTAVWRHTLPAPPVAPVVAADGAPVTLSGAPIHAGSGG
jgi:uncharacterized lipoprotein YddW (UPF0748 family)